jgi:predicted transglutaminase-like cysteine proteinase
MVGNSRAWGAALGLILLAGACGTKSIATEAVEADVSRFDTVPDLAFDPGTPPSSTPGRVFASTKVPARTTGTQARSWSTPARFFTINQVLSKSKGRNNIAGIQLANVNSKEVASDTAPSLGIAGESGEPFGLFTFRAPAGLLTVKWQKIQSDAASEAASLKDCQAKKIHCSHGEVRFGQMLEEAASLTGVTKIEFINQKVNGAIRYRSDIAQWGEPDVWSTPTTVDGKGSFDTGLGDCEDYAIAKYIALKASGVSVEDLRILLVRDRTVGMDHAILAARQAGRWVILDNRWDRLIDDRQTNQFVPLFAMNDTGVKLIAAPYAAKGAPNSMATSVSDAGDVSELLPSWGSSAVTEPTGGSMSLPLFM